MTGEIALKPPTALRADLEGITRANDVLTREEIRAFTTPSTFHGARAVLTTWALVAASLWIVGKYPHPATFVACVVILGGRQLALGVLMHEAAHGTLFRGRWLNDVIADVLCARPIGGDVARYRRHHIKHHTQTGTADDPDLSLVAPFPVSRGALARKLLRDLSGVSGLRRMVGLFLMDLEVLSYTVAADPVRLPWRGLGHHLRALARNALPFVVFQVALAWLLVATNLPWALAAWWAAYLTTYGLFLRIRSIAEHACAERTRDPVRNTRTTRANVLARLTVAPHNVAYHLEHHLLMTVPYFRLPALHALLSKKGVLPPAAVVPGYAAVLELATDLGADTQQAS